MWTPRGWPARSVSDPARSPQVATTCESAFVAAAGLVSTVYQFVPRATDSQDSVVVSFGQIHGGQNANVIPEEVMLEGTVRTLNRDVREKTVQHIRTLAEGIEQVTGARSDVS